MKRIGDLTIPHIASLYAQVPADRLEQFQAFRRAFPYKDLTLDGVTWSYLTGGQGDSPLLLLSGALSTNTKVLTDKNPAVSWRA
jgi:hypothetical protein